METVNALVVLIGILSLDSTIFVLVPFLIKVVECFFFTVFKLAREEIA